MDYRIRLAERYEMGRFASLVMTTGWKHIPEALSFYAKCPGVVPYVAVHGSEIVGTGLATSYDGGTGWLGLITVREDLRRMGIGQALAEWGTRLLESKGAVSVLLVASALGKPMYEKLGYAAGGQYLTFHGLGSIASPAKGLRGITSSDWETISKIDFSATGEKRIGMLRRLNTGYFSTGEGGNVTGYYIPLPWGGGPAITADRSAGERFIDLMQGFVGEGPLTIRVPEANEAATQSLRSRGFERSGSATFMVRGLWPDPYAPERIWGMVSLAVG